MPYDWPEDTDFAFVGARRHGSELPGLRTDDARL